MKIEYGLYTQVCVLTHGGGNDWGLAVDTPEGHDFEIDFQEFIQDMDYEPLGGISVVPIPHTNKYLVTQAFQQKL